MATFEDWGPAGRTYDLVTAAQAWHWIDPVAGPAAAARVLRPGGRLALFWNVGDPPPQTAAAFAEVYRRVRPDLPAFPAGQSALAAYAAGFDKAAGDIRRSQAFDEPEQWRFTWEHTYTRDAWLDQVPTTGTHTTLPRADLDTILTGLGDVIDAAGGSFPMHYTAAVVTARVRPR